MMHKTLLGAALLLSLVSCSDTSTSSGNANTNTQKSADSSARESIDSSAIINNTTPLPMDSTAATVNH